MLKEVEKALEILQVSRPVSIKELKSIYRERIKNVTPDKIKELSQAYKTLINFMENYPFSFTEEEILKAFPEERIKKRFFSDPLWGNS
ncbi:heat shock protein [Thermosulfidibacter takaii ABI70S6]|uniref:Heat shock protein n=1 Tax=Thermosulfidibacter takaii (strain DSM 17441 / JCM 13301 / NBRC 103674 / ABI70S6) TaxID=1298851 RepID=A0A0S3QSC8_THET7|nr:J domain-containing protein [Thermosulfidibacter takaii]BAT71220.1 heat shock protein [Thermosulfidibacter takaii ABI70S6]